MTELDWLFSLGELAVARGDIDSAKAVAHQLRDWRKSDRPFINIKRLAVLWDLLGQSDSALVEIDLWATGLDPARFGQLYTDLRFDSLRLIPRFEEILDRHRREWARTHGGL